MPALSKRGGGSTVNASQLASESTAALLRSQQLGLAPPTTNASAKSKSSRIATANNDDAPQTKVGVSAGQKTSFNLREADTTASKSSRSTFNSVSSVAVAAPSFKAPRAVTKLSVGPSSSSFSALPVSTNAAATQALSHHCQRNNTDEGGQELKTPQTSRSTRFSEGDEGLHSEGGNASVSSSPHGLVLLESSAGRHHPSSNPAALIEHFRASDGALSPAAKTHISPSQTSHPCDFLIREGPLDFASSPKSCTTAVRPSSVSSSPRFVVGGSPAAAAAATALGVGGGALALARDFVPASQHSDAFSEVLPSRSRTPPAPTSATVKYSSIRGECVVTEENVDDKEEKKGKGDREVGQGDENSGETRSSLAASVSERHVVGPTVGGAAKAIAPEAGLRASKRCREEEGVVSSDDAHVRNREECDEDVLPRTIHVDESDDVSNANTFAARASDGVCGGGGPKPVAVAPLPVGQRTVPAVHISATRNLPPPAILGGTCLLFRENAESNLPTLPNHSTHLPRPNDTCTNGAVGPAHLKEPLHAQQNEVGSLQDQAAERSRSAITPPLTTTTSPTPTPTSTTKRRTLLFPQSSNKTLALTGSSNSNSNNADATFTMPPVVPIPAGPARTSPESALKSAHAPPNRTLLFVASRDALQQAEATRSTTEYAPLLLPPHSLPLVGPLAAAGKEGAESNASSAIDYFNIHPDDLIGMSPLPMGSGAPHVSAIDEMDDDLMRTAIVDTSTGGVSEDDVNMFLFASTGGRVPVPAVVGSSSNRRTLLFVPNATKTSNTVLPAVAGESDASCGISPPALTVAPKAIRVTVAVGETPKNAIAAKSSPFRTRPKTTYLNFGPSPSSIEAPLPPNLPQQNSSLAIEMATAVEERSHQQKSAVADQQQRPIQAMPTNSSSSYGTAGNSSEASSRIHIDGCVGHNPVDPNQNQSGQTASSLDNFAAMMHHASSGGGGAAPTAKRTMLSFGSSKKSPPPILNSIELPSPSTIAATIHVEDVTSAKDVPRSIVQPRKRIVNPTNTNTTTSAGLMMAPPPPLPPPALVHNTPEAPPTAPSPWAESLSNAFSLAAERNARRQQQQHPPPPKQPDPLSVSERESGGPTSTFVVSAAECTFGVGSVALRGSEVVVAESTPRVVEEVASPCSSLASPAIPFLASTSGAPSPSILVAGRGSAPAFRTRPSAPQPASRGGSVSPLTAVMASSFMPPSTNSAEAETYQQATPMDSVRVSRATTPFNVTPQTLHSSRGVGATYAVITEAHQQQQQQRSSANATPLPPEASTNLLQQNKQSEAPLPPPPQEVPSSFYGLPDVARHLYRSRGVTRGYEWQEHVLTREDVVSGKNFVYSLPTSGGKTFVAEVVLMRTMLKAMEGGFSGGGRGGGGLPGGAGSSCMFLLPFVSLAEEKCKALQPFADALHFNVEGYYGVQGRFPAPSTPTIFVCTIEKANSLYNHLVEEGRHKMLRCVVVDELHMVGENRRGPILELLLTKIRLASPEAQLVGMSATVPNLQQIAEWLGASCYIGNFRPVPLREHVVVGGVVTERSTEDPTQMTNPRNLPSAATPNDEHMHIMHLLTEVPNCSTLVFCATRDQCLQYARQITKTFERMRTGPRPEVGNLLADLRGLGHEARNLSELVSYGVAYHTGALSLEERDVVERGFKSRQITILCCTSTLAAGVNLPARRVIFKTPYVAKEFLQKSMYTQMCGRAGRAGYDVFGESFLMLSRKDFAQGMRLVMDTLPPVHSGLFLEKHGLARALMESLNVGVFATTTNAKVWTRALMANFTQQPIPEKLITDAFDLVSTSPLFATKEKEKEKGGEGKSCRKKKGSKAGRSSRKAAPNNNNKSGGGGASSNLHDAAVLSGTSSSSSFAASRQSSLIEVGSPTPRRTAQKRCREGEEKEQTAGSAHAGEYDALEGGAGFSPSRGVHTLTSLSQQGGRSLSLNRRRLRRKQQQKDGDDNANSAVRRRLPQNDEEEARAEEEEVDIDSGEEEDGRDPIDILIEGSIITLVNYGFLTVERVAPPVVALAASVSGGDKARQDGNSSAGSTLDPMVAAMYGMLGLVGGNGSSGGNMQMNSDCPWGGPSPNNLVSNGLALTKQSAALATAAPASLIEKDKRKTVDLSQPADLPPAQQYKLALTPFGSASVRACFGIEEALLVRAEMEMLQESGVILTDDLQICYLVTPVMDPIECNWGLFAKQLSSVSEARMRIAASVGLDIGFVHQRSVGLNFASAASSAPAPQQTGVNKSTTGSGGSCGINGISIDQHGRRVADPAARKLYVCRRYYAALVLSDILNEIPAATIESRYGLTYTQQQALLRSSSIFSTSMVTFCNIMSWFNVEALLAAFVKRLGFGVKPDIIPLMEINGVKASKARVLFAAGFRSPALIAGANPQELFKRVKESNPKDNKAVKFFTLKSAVVVIREANVVLQRQLREKKGELEEMALRAKMA